MSSIFRKRRPGERGYSLVEALVVVAIIGVISVVTIPNFISLYRSFRFKTSLRQFTGDIRYARQQSVTKNQWGRLSFVPGTRNYRILLSPDGGTTWNLTSFRGELGEMGYFHSSSTFADVDTNGSLDITFKNNGTVLIAGSVVMRTDDDVPKNQYTIGVQTTGKLTTTAGTF